MLTDYLIDRRDQILLGQTPALMMPRFGELPALAIGQRRYIVANDGVYVEKRSPVMHVIARIAESPPLPFGKLNARIEMIGGTIPYELYDAFCDRAVNAAPIEAAAFILWDEKKQEYVLLHCQGIDASAGHITYSVGDINKEYVICDWHSHGHGHSFFSTTDDASDAEGLYIASVFGRCDDKISITTTSRIVIDGIHIPISWEPWDNVNALD